MFFGMGIGWYASPIKHCFSRWYSDCFYVRISYRWVEHLLLAAQAHLGPADLEEIKIISPKKLKEVQSDRVNRKEFPFYLPGLKVIEKGTCSSCKGALLVAMRRLYKERSSPHCTILMGQRLRERKKEFASNFKYGTVKSAKPLVSIGQCCSWSVLSIDYLTSPLLFYFY